MEQLTDINKIYLVYFLGFLACIFQVLAWYSHTVFPDNYSMYLIILLSWLIALIEFIFLIPAINIAHKNHLNLTLFTVYKVAIFFVCFSLFNTFILGAEFLPKYLIAYLLMGFSIYLLN